MQPIVQGIVERYHLRKAGSRYVGQCPKCGGSDRTDKFQIREDGGYKCYACGDFKGDIITWLREMEGMTCPEAHQAAGQDCRVGAACRAWTSCRFGDGRAAAGRALPRPVAVPRRDAKALPLAKEGSPAERWASFAAALVAEAAAALPSQKAVLTWLASRGIDAAAVGRFRLGWLARDRKVDRESIGLEPERAGKRELWVPGGLLIPVLDHGAVHRLKIRRPAWSRERFLPDLKYMQVEGSGRAPMLISPSSGVVRGAVAVEAELDGMACAAAHDGVLVVALGTAQYGPTEAQRSELAAAPVILVALDAEQDKDGKAGAGPAAVAAWLRAYRQARFWPVPAGKDPGDYVKEHGGDLRAWLEAGLPPVAHAAASVADDHMSPPGCSADGGAGVADDVSTDGRADGEDLERRIVLTDGRSFLLTNSRPERDAEVDAGGVAFTGAELERLRPMVDGLVAADRSRALALVMDVKEVFAGAYIAGNRLDCQVAACGRVGGEANGVR